MGNRKSAHAAGNGALCDFYEATFHSNISVEIQGKEDMKNATKNKI